MAGEIPIQNIYYLLCYAWNHLDEADEIDITANGTQSLDELFARVLTQGTQHLLKRGLDRDYQLHREETAALKGRFDLTASMATQTWRQGRMVCEFDDFSHDILHNRILKTTISQLADNPYLEKDTATELHQLEKQLARITPVRITSRLFRKVRLHRNNRQYRLLMNVCELVHDSLLPTEKQGSSRFRDFIRDEKKMPLLFEAFVRNFYAHHSHFKVSAAQLSWNVEAEAQTKDLVPIMKTDVSLYSPERQIIIDCKFYKQAFKANYGKERFNRDHLFQLFAYLENVAHSKNWHNTEGVILYPSVGNDFHHHLALNNHPLTLCSINLNQDWKIIESRLFDILSPAISDF